MYEWIPTKNNRKTVKLIMLLFLGAGLLMATTVAFRGIPYRWAFQLVALGLLTVAIFFTTRYVMKSFLYRVISDGQGGEDLTVSELTSGGRRQVTVCRVGLEGIYERIFLDFTDGGASQSRWREIKKTRRKIFDYSADLKPKKCMVLYLREGGEDLTLRLDYDKTLYDLLTPTEQEDA